MTILTLHEKSMQFFFYNSYTVYLLVHFKIHSAEKKIYKHSDITHQHEITHDRNLPMVEMKVVLKASSENRKSMHVLPTPESPISNNLNNKSYAFLAISQYNKRT